jgi:ubiquinone/menaquinone biosynthesis C-methylase UbiE
MPKIKSVSEDTGKYVHERTREEYQRLRDQARLFEELTKSILERVGLKDGMKCLDVGCGPGAAMKLMGERVGTRGSVIGVDIDPNAGREALRFLTGSGESNYGFVEANVEKVTSIRSEEFDLVFARGVLIHLKDPLKALSKMYGWTKPGGYIVAQESYLATMNFFPAVKPLVEWRNLIFRLYRENKIDLEFGLKLPHYFIKAGIGAPDDVSINGLMKPLSDQDTISWLRGMLISVLPRAMQLGVASEKECNALAESLNDLGNEASHYFIYPLAISLSKMKKAQ